MAAFAWAPMGADDVPAVMDIAARLHPGLPERRDVFDERRRLFPDGCRVYANAAGAVAGYGVAYPWRLHTIPKLDAFIGALPAAPDCLFVHDVALLPEARGHGGAEDFIGLMRGVVRTQGLAALACVSVYGTDVFWSRLGFAAVACDEVGGYGDTAKYMIAAAPPAR